MKKEEAMLLAESRSKLVIEYIETILSGEDIVTGDMRFSSYKIDDQKMCTLDIVVPKTNFEKHLNLEITTDHCDVLYAQLFKDFLKTFLEHETIGVSKYYTVKYSMQENFTGVSAVNSNGSKLKINFLSVGEKFDEIAQEYNKAINDYIEKHTQQPTVGTR